MREERIELSQRERDRLKILHQVEQGYLTQAEAGQRVQVSARQVRPGLRGGAGGGRTAARRYPLGPLPRLLSQPAARPQPAAGSPFRPTAYRACRAAKPETETQVHSPSRSPSEEDISIGQKMGHFYFALTEATNHLDKAALPVRLVEQLRFTLWTTRLLSTPQFPRKVKSSALQTAVFFGANRTPTVDSPLTAFGLVS